jgi:NAD-dependent dihydropyrimidine dehydrogenase PreA subunit
MLDKNWFIDKINTFLREDESNRMTGVDGSLFWEPNVLIGFCSGNDPIFQEYKKLVGPFHLTPKEAFTKYCEIYNIEIDSTENLTVVAFILPMNPLTKKENFEYSPDWPSERWAHTRLYGEEANVKLWKYLLSELKKEFGILGVAPAAEQTLFKRFKRHKDAWQGRHASTWSHRHMCFASGLGSFGLSDGFINERGKAMRCGSFVINHKLPSDDDKRAASRREHCIMCGDCVSRCPVEAITMEEGHNKHKCFIKNGSTIPYIREHYKISIYGCGLCQVGVSCTDGIPKKA